MSFEKLIFPPLPYSVLVHSGGGHHGGHYYAFICPDGSQWLKFDDTKVEKVESSRAVEQQFGESSSNWPQRGHGQSNAYMLAYVRISDWEHVMHESFQSDDVLDSLRKRHQVGSIGRS